MRRTQARAPTSSGAERPCAALPAGSAARVAVVAFSFSMLSNAGGRYVLEACGVEVLDPPVKGHRRSPWSAWNREISGDDEQRVNFIAAERDFRPGHHFLYHVRVTTPEPGPWPVAALLEGDPPPRDVVRATVVTGGAPI